MNGPIFNRILLWELANGHYTLFGFTNLLINFFFFFPGEGGGVVKGGHLNIKSK